MNFVHASDFHLGYVQYGLKERFRDFARTFDQVVDYTTGSDAEFLLISGDIFHKRNINAPTYMQAFKILKKLKDHGIPVYAIEGNHDLAYHRDLNSWMQILDAQGMLKLFRVKRNENDPELKGDFTDINGVRIFGVQYLGAQTRNEIPNIAQYIKNANQIHGKPDYTILMMHFGMEGKLGYGGGDIAELSYNSLLPLRDKVDYLALGHYHIRYEYDGWVFNGGSCELMSMAEYKRPKGFYHAVDGKTSFKTVKIRPVRKFEINTDGIQSLHDLYINVQSVVDGAQAIEGEPIIEIDLHGALKFKRTDISVDKIKEICKNLNPLIVRTKITDTSEPMSRPDATLTYSRIERDVITEFVKNRPRYRKDLENVVNTILEAKKLSIAKADPETILEKLKASFNTIESDKTRKQTDLPFDRGGAGAD